MGSRLPIIGYDNLLEQGTVTAVNWTDEENCYDWLTYDVATSAAAAASTIETDIGASETADYLAFHGHNIGTIAVAVKLEYWTGAAYADVPGSTFTPSDDTTQFVRFPAVSATKFRFSLTTGGTAATIAVLSFGELLDLERGCQAGFVPPPLSRVDTILNAGSEGGQFLGRSLLRTGVAGSLSLQLMTEFWVRNDLDTFIEHAREKGWFLQWNEAEHADEAAYCRTTATPQPSYSEPGFMSAEIGYVGLTE